MKINLDKITNFVLIVAVVILSLVVINDRTRIAKFSTCTRDYIVARDDAQNPRTAASVNRDNAQQVANDTIPEFFASILALTPDGPKSQTDRVLRSVKASKNAFKILSESNQKLEEARKANPIPMAESFCKDSL